MRESQVIPTLKSLQLLFDTIDVNHDGRVTLTEWVNAFDRVDRNQNGAISRKEWCQHQGDTSVFDAISTKKHLASITRGEWQRAFSMLDANKDGTISVYEWGSPGVEGRTVQFDMHDCTDVLVLRSLVWHFDGLGAIVIRAKSEPSMPRLQLGDRIVNINGHFVYGESRENIEFQFRRAQSMGRHVRLTFEERPDNWNINAVPKPGDRLQAIVARPHECREGDLGRVYFMDEEYLYITWELTGVCTHIPIDVWMKYCVVVGQIKVEPEMADLVQSLPGDPSQVKKVELGVVTLVTRDNVHILWNHCGSRRTVPKEVFLRYYTCVDRFAL